MTFEPRAARAVSNKFCDNRPPISEPASGKYKYQVSFTMLSACDSNDTVTSGDPIIARVRFLYNSSPLGVSVTGKALPQQGQKIVSTGETPSGVSRKLEVNRFYPTLPAIFDYVLYNGSSSNALTK